MGRRGRGVSWILALAAFGALAVAASAAASIPTGNLVANPGAELGRELPVLGWTNPFPQVTASDYVEPGTEGDFLSVDDPGTNGCRGFFGDTSSESRDATQLIDVSEAATEIDETSVTAEMTGRIGHMPDGDYSSFEFAFLDAGGAQLDSFGVNGSILAPAAELVAFAGDEIVPVGTREILVTITTTRVVGPNNAYVDDVGLTLDDSDPMLPFIDCARSGRSLTIRYAARSKTFKGKLRSGDPDCRPGKVKVFKLKPGQDRKVASDTAAASGRWSAKERKARGKYYATTDETRGEGLVCQAARSKKVKA